MRFLFFIVILFINARKVVPQSKNVMVKISSISVYKDFQQRGYTSVGAFTHFDDMKKNGIAQINLDFVSKEKLEMILNKAEKKKHHKTKLGINNIFCEIKFDDRITVYNKVIISGVGIVYNMFGIAKEERAIITDLTNEVDYKITNAEDLKWLSEFSELIKNR